jgi:hypothetical protein
MSIRPGYEALVADRGREAADAIVARAESYSDGAHRDWDAALQWAIEQYDRSEDPMLTAQQHENTRLHDDLMRRRGDDGRRITYLALALGGDADDHAEGLSRAEAIYDVEGWRLPPDAPMRDELDWAAAQARAAGTTSAEGATDEGS